MVHMTFKLKINILSENLSFHRIDHSKGTTTNILTLRKREVLVFDS